MSNSRCYSAPPIDKFIINEDIEFEDMQHELSYSTYYQRKKDPRLAPPKFVFSGQGSLWASEYKDFIISAFSERRTAVEMIDADHPGSASCSEFSGRRSTTTPVGNKPSISQDFLTSSSSSILIPVATTPPIVSPKASPVFGEIKAFYAFLEREVPADLSTMCVSLCKDQEGSRFLQNKLEEWGQGEISCFFSKICEASADLSVNLFGNYVIQKIIPLLKEEEIFKLIIQFFGRVYELSLHIYGCRVIQKLIDNLGDIKFVVAELESHVMELIESPNGNHVIQKCIDKDIDRSFILREFEKNGVLFAKERYGCRVLQRLFEICPEDETEQIFCAIVGRMDQLINDKYGNYVIQHLVQHDNRSKERMFDQIIRDSYRLSKFKFSSNVIEKCVDTASEAQLEAFLKEFLKEGEFKRPYLYYMCTDMYANYVVQRLFDVAPPEIKNKAKAALLPYIKEMKVIPFTRHILSRLT